jgi:Tfp pilus assembly protein PilX
MNTNRSRMEERLHSEEGYIALFAALVLLVLLSIIGISASRIASTEITMVRNELIYQRNFFMAEGAAMEAADRLANTADLKDHMPVWMETAHGALDYANLRTYFSHATDPFATVIPQASELDLNRTLYVGGVDGTAPGEGLDPDRPKIHAISVYGRCEWDGVSIIKIGYRAAY